MMATDEGRRRGLGRGLSALLGEAGESGEGGVTRLDEARTARMVPVEFLKTGPFQPRKRFDDDAFEALVDSVREKGVLQPLLVRPDTEDPQRFEIVAGERRWRAAQQARLHDVPVVVRELSDSETLEIALVENLQREDLTPLEEAEAYRRLMEEFGQTQEAVSRAVGKSRSHIANTVRLLGLPDTVRRMLDDGELSAGHARTLINSTDPEALAREIVRRSLNVRQTEDLTRKEKHGATGHHDATKRHGASAHKDPNVLDLERGLADRLGLKVNIADKRDGAGRITIHYGTPEQLEDVVRRIRRDFE
jgi:ParB family chromosome partitioning protein